MKQGFPEAGRAVVGARVMGVCEPRLPGVTEAVDEGTEGGTAGREHGFRGGQPVCEMLGHVSALQTERDAALILNNTREEGRRKTWQ